MSAPDVDGAAGSPAFEAEQKLIDYLLGRLPENEQAEIESRLFTEDDLHDELMATADDLIHDYLAGALSADDRGRFESDFLAVPAHRERLSFLRNMLSAVERVPAEEIDEVDDPATSAASGRRSWQWWSQVAATILALVGTLIVLAVRKGPQPGPQVAVAPSPTFTIAAIPSVKPSTPESASNEPTETRTVRLPKRSGSSVDVAVTSRTRLVRLEVPAPDDEHPGFNAIVRAANGKSVWSAQALAPAAAGLPLVLYIPARLLTSGHYTVRIEGESLRDTTAPKPLVVEYRLSVSRNN